MRWISAACDRTDRTDSQITTGFHFSSATLFLYQENAMCGSRFDANRAVNIYERCRVKARKKNMKIKRRSIAKKWKNAVIIITVVSYTKLPRFLAHTHSPYAVNVTATYTLTQFCLQRNRILTRICNGKKCKRVYALMRPITVLGQGFLPRAKRVSYDSCAVLSAHVFISDYFVFLNQSDFLVQVWFWCEWEQNYTQFVELKIYIYT